jgi:hypothetical protein
MKEKELQSAKEKGIAVKEIAVAIDMIVPVLIREIPLRISQWISLKGFMTVQ